MASLNYHIVLICAIGGIFLSRRRRRAVVRLALFSAAGLFITLVSLRIVREIIASKVNPSYAQAVREATQIIFHPLVLQTATLIIVFGINSFEYLG